MVQFVPSEDLCQVTALVGVGYPVKVTADVRTVPGTSELGLAVGAAVELAVGPDAVTTVMLFEASPASVSPVSPYSIMK